MNLYEIIVYDYSIKDRFTYELQAANVVDASRRAFYDTKRNQIVETIRLKLRGVVPFDLCSGTSQS